MIMTGYPYENGQKTEIIDLLNPNSKINYPALEADIPERNGLVGGLLEENLLICGGGIIYPDDERYFRKCYVIGRYSARNLEMSIRFSLKSRPSERFHRPEMSQIEAEISLHTNVKLSFHKN